MCNISNKKKPTTHMEKGVKFPPLQATKALVLVQV